MDQQLVRAYGSLFVHCRNYYAVQQQDGSYRPVCSPVTPELLASHLAGEVTLGTYVLDRGGLCSFAVLDADTRTGARGLFELWGQLAHEGIFSLLEKSRRGFHLWVFFAVPTSGQEVRAWLLPFARELGVELYPRQDAVLPSGFGSLIRLPLGVHRQSGRWYPFLTRGAGGLLSPVGQTIGQCCLWAARTARRVRVPEQVEMVSSGEKDVQQTGPEMGEPGRGKGAIRRWCRSVDIVEVIGRYVQLDGRGMGSCPFKEHHHRGDVRPSFQVFGGNDPHWYCYTWGRAGNVFDFVCLYYGLSVQEAFERIEQGSLW